MHSSRHSKDSIHENETQKYLDCYLENQNIIRGLFIDLLGPCSNQVRVCSL